MKFKTILDLFLRDYEFKYLNDLVVDSKKPDNYYDSNFIKVDSNVIFELEDREKQ